MAKFDRKCAPRELNLGTLIVVEGETEEKYFKDFKESRRLSNLEVVTARHPTDIMGTVKDIIKNGYSPKGMRRTLYPPRSFKDVYVVFDVDEKPDLLERNLAEIKELDGKVKLAQRKGEVIHVVPIVSNPCFEIWPLLQRKELHPHEMPISQCLEEMEKYFPGYKKGKNNRLPVLSEEELQKCCQRAERLRERKTDPSDLYTDIDRLMQDLQKMAE